MHLGWGSEHAVPDEEAEEALRLIGVVSRSTEESGWQVALSDQFTTRPFGDVPDAYFIVRIDTEESVGDKMTFGTTCLNLGALRK